jgi:hypothetical protein
MLRALGVAVVPCDCVASSTDGLLGRFDRDGDSTLVERTISRVVATATETYTDFDLRSDEITR